MDILIVDDETDIRELVAGILQDEGYLTRTARDSDEALNAVATRRNGTCQLSILIIAPAAEEAKKVALFLLLVVV